MFADMFVYFLAGCLIVTVIALVCGFALNLVTGTILAIKTAIEALFGQRG